MPQTRLRAVTDGDVTQELSFEDLKSMASILVIAGSETTASLLCGVTFLLLRNPTALKKVTEEVRGSFKSEDEITLTSVNGLKYMLACLNEALRVYPPLTGGLQRRIPPGGGKIAGVEVPEEVSLLTRRNQSPLTKAFRPQFPSRCMPHTTPKTIGAEPQNTIPRDLWAIQSSPPTGLKCSNPSPMGRRTVSAERKCHTCQRGRLFENRIAKCLAASPSRRCDSFLREFSIASI